MYNCLKKVACFAITLSCAVSGDAIATQEYGNPWRHTLASPPTDATRRAFYTPELKDTITEYEICLIPQDLWNWSVKSKNNLKTAAKVGWQVYSWDGTNTAIQQLHEDVSSSKTTVDAALDKLFDLYERNNRHDEIFVLAAMHWLRQLGDDPTWIEHAGRIGDLFVYFFEGLIRQRCGAGAEDKS